MFEPLRITAYLRCGVVSDPWLPIEGVLLYEAMRRRYGVPEASLPGVATGTTVGRLDAVDVPLLMAHDGDYAYYACSFAEWGQPYGEGQDHWNKRNDDGQFLELLSTNVKRIDAGAGRYKTYHMPIFYRVAPWVQWYAVGNPAEVEGLLQGVAGLGKKRAYGWGSVIRWEVEATPEDRSLWHDGVPQRAIPATRHQERELRRTGQTLRARLMQWSYKPPYYEAANQAMCYMPQAIRIAGR